MDIWDSSLFSLTFGLTPAFTSGHTLLQTAVGSLLQHNAARAHAGFVRGLTSDNVLAEYLLCAFAQCESLGGWLAQADAARRFLEKSDERPGDTPGFWQ